MNNLEHYLKIHLGSTYDSLNVVGQDDYNVCWKAAVENVLDNIIDKLKELEDKK